MSGAEACEHVNVEAHVGIVLLEDTGKRQAEIRAWCNDCDEPFLWPSRVPIGVDLSGVARSFDAQELRVALHTGGQP